MKPLIKILIVEDEILIADTIERYLKKKGYEVVGIAISYEEAMALYKQKSPDLVLIDIRLFGLETGIDFAKFLINQVPKTPFIYLTSQLDSRSIENAKTTFPAGYLSKPIQRESLYTTIEIALHNYRSNKQEVPTINIFDGQQNHIVSLNDILYLQADHIYIKLLLSDNKHLVCRITLKEMLDKLASTHFVQTHRSYAVNIKKVSNWDSQYLYVDSERIPISRGRKKEVLSILQTQ